MILSKENGVITIRPVENLGGVPALFAQVCQTMGDVERLELDDTDRKW